MKKLLLLSILFIVGCNKSSSTGAVEDVVPEPEAKSCTTLSTEFMDAYTDFAFAPTQSTCEIAYTAAQALIDGGCNTTNLSTGSLSSAGCAQMGG